MLIYRPDPVLSTERELGLGVCGFFNQRSSAADYALENGLGTKVFRDIHSVSFKSSRLEAQLLGEVFVQTALLTLLPCVGQLGLFSDSGAKLLYVNEDETKTVRIRLESAGVSIRRIEAKDWWQASMLTKYELGVDSVCAPHSAFGRFFGDPETLQPSFARYHASDMVLVHSGLIWGVPDVLSAYEMYFSRLFSYFQLLIRDGVATSVGFFVDSLRDMGASAADAFTNVVGDFV